MTFDFSAERDKFITDNLGLVKDRVLALNKGIFDDDLFQVGSIGLIKATDKFDKNSGFKFSTYARYRIDGHIKDYKRYDSIIKPLAKKGGGYQYKSIASLDEPIDDTGLRLGDTFCECDGFEDEITSKILFENFMDNLCEREEKVIKMWLKGMLQKNISKETHINQPQVSIIVRRVGEKYKCYQFL